jgi:hypothetical protein
VRRSTFQLSLSIAAAAATSAPGFAQVSFTIDGHGPTIGVPDAYSGVPITQGDILTPSTALPFGPNLPALAAPAPPGVMISGGFGPPGPGLGIGTHPLCIGSPPGSNCPIEVDALSYGRDFPIPPNTPLPPGMIRWSVDEWAVGLPGLFAVVPIVTSEGAVAPNMEASADVFIDVGIPVPPPLPPFAIPPANTALIDGNGLPNTFPGTAYPGFGLVEPNPTGAPPPDFGDNVDGFDIGFSNFPVYFSMDAPWTDPIGGIGISVPQRNLWAEKRRRGMLFS